jgi:hypothetical protein
VPRIYEIVAVPAVRPEIIPLVSPADATAGAVLLHVPPVGVLANVVVEPMHTLVVPVIAVGSGLTVIVFVVLQPELNV